MYIIYNNMSDKYKNGNIRMYEYMYVCIHTYVCI